MQQIQKRRASHSNGWKTCRNNNKRPKVSNSNLVQTICSMHSAKWPTTTGASSVSDCWHGKLGVWVIKFGAWLFILFVLAQMRPLCWARMLSFAVSLASLMIGTSSVSLSLGSSTYPRSCVSCFICLHFHYVSIRMLFRTRRDGYF